MQSFFVDFLLDDLSSVEGGLLKSPTIIVLSVSPFGSVLFS